MQSNKRQVDQEPMNREEPSRAMQYMIFVAYLNFGREGRVLDVAEFYEFKVLFGEVSHALKWMVQEGYMRVTRRVRERGSTSNRNVYYALTAGRGVEYAYKLIKEIEDTGR